MKNPFPNPNKYNTPAAFFEGLVRREDKAIVLLRDRIWPSLLYWGKGSKVERNDLEEIALDAVLITLQKIENQSFQFEDKDPSGYAALVAKNMIRNFLRKKKLPLGALEDWDAAEEAEIEKQIQHKELQLQLAQLLDQLGENCKQLIQLKYLEERRDEEVLQLKLTPYNTIDSIRSKRGTCLKRLRQLWDDLTNKEGK